VDLKLTVPFLCGLEDEERIKSIAQALWAGLFRPAPKTWSPFSPANPSTVPLQQCWPAFHFFYSCHFHCFPSKPLNYPLAAAVAAAAVAAATVGKLASGVWKFQTPDAGTNLGTSGASKHGKCSTMPGTVTSGMLHPGTN
jgi:hypothetical protein